MSKPANSLEIVEWATWIGSIVCVILAMLWGDVLLGVLPVPFLLFLNLINRQRLEQRIKRAIITATKHLRQQIQEDLDNMEVGSFHNLSKGVMVDQQTATLYQIQEAISLLQTQLQQVSQAANVDLEPLCREIAKQRRSLTNLQEQYGSLEKSVESVIDYLNKSYVPNRISKLEKGLTSVTKDLSHIQNQIESGIKNQLTELDQHLSAMGIDGNTLSRLQSQLDLIQEYLQDLGLESNYVPIPEEDTFVEETPIPLDLELVGTSYRSAVITNLDENGTNYKLAGSINYSLDHNWEPIHSLSAHGDWVHSLAITPDTKILASGSFDRSIKLWKIATGELVHTLSHHQKGVFTIVISGDGQTLASGSWDNTIKVWYLRTGELIYTINSHEASVRSLVITPDGKRLISASFDQSIKVWDYHTGEYITTISDDLGAIYAITLAPDGKTLVCGGGNGNITLWDFHPNQISEPYRLETGSSSLVCSLVMSSDGNYLVSGSADGKINIWERMSNQSHFINPGDSGPMMSLVITPDNQTLIGGRADGTIKIWNLRSGELLNTLNAESSGIVISLAISSDGQTLASGTGDGMIKIWQKN